MERRPGYVGPLLLLSIGFILLFNNLGILPWEIWDSLWRYWSVILILFGIEILGRHAESNLMYMIAIFLSVLLIIGTVFLAWNAYPEPVAIGKNLKGAKLNDSQIEDKNLDFANLDGADLSNSNLNGANMNFASMRYANFSNSSLKGINMNFADIQNAKFDNANLEGANLNFADLAYSDLRNSVLDGANLNFVDLNGANMAGARISGVSHVFAGTSRSTICPDSTNGPCW